MPITRGPFFFFHTSTFQLPDKPRSQLSTLSPPPVLAFIFYIAHRVQQSHCSSNFHRVLLTHALALSASQKCAQEKVPTDLYKYALGKTRTHETDLYQARGQPDTPTGRPAILWPRVVLLCRRDVVAPRGALFSTRPCVTRLWMMPKETTEERPP